MAQAGDAHRPARMWREQRDAPRGVGRGSAGEEEDTGGEAEEGIETTTTTTEEGHQLRPRVGSSSDLRVDSYPSQARWAR
uniref:Uncharacterized protein n=1 Tax=Oryza brachyantha TaxID=4533 RepID=J3LCF9_ORYBR